MADESSFSLRIRELRGERNQQEVADSLGVLKSKWSRWEKGHNEPSLSDIASLCRIFGVSANWLLGLPEQATEKSPKTGGLKNNIRQIHNLAEKMTVKTNELLSLTEEMEKAL